MGLPLFITPVEPPNRKENEDPMIRNPAPRRRARWIVESSRTGSPEPRSQDNERLQQSPSQLPRRTQSISSTTESLNSSPPSILEGIPVFATVQEAREYVERIDRMLDRMDEGARSAWIAQGARLVQQVLGEQARDERVVADQDAIIQGMPRLVARQESIGDLSLDSAKSEEEASPSSPGSASPPFNPYYTQPQNLSPRESLDDNICHTPPGMLILTQDLRRQNNSLQRSLQSKETTITYLQEQIATNNSTISDYSRLIDNTVDEMRHFETERRDWAAAIESKDQNIEWLKGALDEEIQICEDAIERLQSARGEIARLEGKVEEQKQEIERMGQPVAVPNHMLQNPMPLNRLIRRQQRRQDRAREEHNRNWRVIARRAWQQQRSRDRSERFQLRLRYEADDEADEG